MAETLEPRLLTGWQIEALPEGRLVVNLRYVRLEDSATAYGVLLALPPEQTEALIADLTAKLAQAQGRRTPAPQ